MRIAIISGSIPSTTFIDAVANGMAERGYTMILIGKKRGDYNYHSNVKCIEMPKSKMGRLLFILMNFRSAKRSDISLIYTAADSFKQFYYDLLFYLPIFKSNCDKVHFQWASSLYKRELLFKLFPNKILLSLRGSHITYTPIIKPIIGEYYKKIFPFVYRFHSVSNSIALIASNYGATRSKLFTIYSSVANELLQQPIKKRDTDNCLKIIVVGRFHWVKGYRYLLDALYQIKLRGHNFNVQLIAGAEVPEEISFAINQYNLHGNISVFNNIPHNEVLKSIQESDLLVLPSIDEGIANVVLEAMALGTIVISSDCGGMQEAIENGVNGFLYENRNVDDLVSRLINFYLLNSTAKYNLALNARQTILEKFSNERMLNQYQEFYK